MIVGPTRHTAAKRPTTDRLPACLHGRQTVSLFHSFELRNVADQQQVTYWQFDTPRLTTHDGRRTNGIMYIGTKLTGRRGLDTGHWAVDTTLHDSHNECQRSPTASPNANLPSLHMCREKWLTKLTHAYNTVAQSYFNRQQVNKATSRDWFSQL